MHKYKFDICVEEKELISLKFEDFSVFRLLPASSSSSSSSSFL